MEFSILYAIQGIRTDFLDQFMVLLTKISGSYGEIWLVIGLLLCIFKKTRKAGISAIIGYGLVMLLGQVVLKDWIARPRPCHLDETIELLISRPSSFSCPSTHSGLAFAAATAIFAENKKLGIPALILALIIAFSRMYLFVHFPTDVLFGIVLGVLAGILSVKLVRRAAQKLEQKKQKA